MTPEQKRIAIAEAASITLDSQGRWMSPYGWIPFKPDEDLNAIAEAEKGLSSSQIYTYVQWLPIGALSTAALRADAFLKTIGKL